MPNCKCAYEPREDSTFLEKHVRQYSFGKVLDMGTGSGIQAIAAAQNPKVNSVVAADIHKGTINYCKKNIKNRKIKFIRSDLFDKIKGRFDTIIFNPPYLPDDEKIKDIALDGGKHGYDVIERFLKKVNDFLIENGIILLLFSSFTKKGKVDELIKSKLLDFKELEDTSFFFEKLFVYKIWKGEFLKRLEKKGISKIEYLTKGHRGLLFTGLLEKRKKIVIKMKNQQSAAIGRIANEAKWLKALNKKSIGPRLIESEDDYFIYEYINGDFITDFAKKSNSKEIRNILKKIFEQMYTLDKMKADKEEMHHPFKHIIVENSRPYLIDFERMHHVKHPKNVTQFCQFLINSSFSELLAKKGIIVVKNSLIDIAKVYKKDNSISNFRKIVGAI